MWFDIQGFQNCIAAHIDEKRHIANSAKISYFAARTWEGYF